MNGQDASKGESEEDYTTFSKLYESEIPEVTRYKEDDNRVLREPDFDIAETALDIFGSRLGSYGPQRDTFITSVPNLYFVYLKKNLFNEAKILASKVLGTGRGQARLKISLGTQVGGDLPRF